MWDSGNHTIERYPAGVVSTWPGQRNHGSADLTEPTPCFTSLRESRLILWGTFMWPTTAITRSGNHAGEVVTTLAGSPGSSGTNDAIGSSARFTSRRRGGGQHGIGLCADTANSAIRKVTAAGVVSTLAGSAGNSGSADARNQRAILPARAVAVDSTGNVYVGDYFNHTSAKSLRLAW